MTHEHVPEDGQLIRPDIDMLHPSPTNPRKIFDEVELQELADSIKSYGLMQPIVARIMPHAMRAALDTQAELEIVAGERRWRASKLAGLPDALVLLRTLTDEAVVAMQIIENLQRANLSAIEEAEGYGVLQRQGMTPIQIAEAVSKTKAYIYAKLKLLDLGDEARQKMRDGELSESIALFVARTPAALQARATALVTAVDCYGNRPSVRSAANILRNSFTKHLTRAWFAQDDDAIPLEMGAHAPACTSCPHRMGNEPGCDEDNADVCMNPECYQQKQDGWQSRRRIEAICAGSEIISGAEARAIKPHCGFSMEQGHVNLDSKCFELEGYPTYRSLAGKVPGAVHVTLLDSPHKDEGLIEIINKKALSDALRSSGIELIVRDNSQEAAQRAKNEADLQADNLFRGQLFAEIRRQPVLMLTTPDLILIADFALSKLFEETRFRIAQLWYPDEKRRDALERLHERIGNMDDSELMRLLRDIVLIDESKRGPWNNDPPTKLLAAAARIGIDPDQVKNALTRKATASQKKPEEIRFMHPQNRSLTWSGKGKRPQWVVSWLADGGAICDLKAPAQVAA
jgi:ParB/RepB/Spo0J family partition protein